MRPINNESNLYVGNYIDGMFASNRGSRNNFGRFIRYGQKYLFEDIKIENILLKTLQPHVSRDAINSFPGPTKLQPEISGIN